MAAQIFGAWVTSFAFAAMFNIRGKKLWAASLIGMIGGVCAYLFTLQGMSKVMALFYSSMIVSVLSEVFARIYKTPVTCFLLSALIPLVPGTGMYYTMSNIVKEDYSYAFQLGIQTLFQASSIVIGSTMVSSFVKIIYHYRNK